MFTCTYDYLKSRAGNHKDKGGFEQHDLRNSKDQLNRTKMKSILMMSPLVLFLVTMQTREKFRGKLVLFISFFSHPPKTQSRKLTVGCVWHVYGNGNSKCRWTGKEALGKLWAFNVTNLRGTYRDRRS